MTDRPPAPPTVTDEGSERLYRRSSELSPLRSTPVLPRLLGQPMRVDLLALIGLLLATAFLWGRARGIWFWEDEAIAVGIARHPLGDLPDLLRVDGSPPLYYALLNGWMSLFGSSEASTHVLSLLFALAVVPAALWAGWSLFGRRAGWMCAALAAVNPYLAHYSTETRMYSLVALLSLVATAAFIHAFVFGRRRFAVLFAVALVLLMYTHNWGLLFALGAGAALVPCLVQSSDRPRLLRDALLTFGAVALAYAPWVPTLLYQIRQDLQPWALPATLTDVRDTVLFMMGGIAVVGVLGLGAALGLTGVLRRPWSRTALAVAAVAVIVGVMLVGGWRTVLTYRYLGAVVGPILLVLGLGLANGGRLAVAALAVTVLLTAPIGAKKPPYHKSNARAVAEAVSPDLRRGDVIVSPNFELVPLVAHYLPPGLRYATTEGPVRDLFVVDWRDALDRLRRADPAVTVPPVIESVPVGGRVLVVCPPPDAPSALQNDPGEGPGRTTLGSGDVDDAAVAQTTPVPDSIVLFHALHRYRCRQVNEMLLGDPRLELERTLDAPTGEVHSTVIEAYLLKRVAA